MKQSNTLVGILWLSLAEILFVACWTAIKFLGSRLPLFEIVFFRAIISVVVLLPLVWWHMRSFRGSNLRRLFLRSLFGWIAMCLSFYGMIHLRMGNAATLINTMPVFVALLSPAMLGEPLARKQFVFILLAFAGVGFILKPDATILNAPAILTLASGLLTALAMIQIRQLHATDTTMTITFYFTAISAILTAPLAVRGFLMPTISEAGWLIFIGVVISFAQLFMTRAYRYAGAATIAPFTYVAVIGAFVAGLIFFEEIPDGWSLIGAAIIAGGGIGVMLTAPHPEKVRQMQAQGSN